MRHILIRIKAATDVALSASAGTYCRSTIAREFAVESYSSGTDALLASGKATVDGKFVVVPGPLARRQTERAMFAG